jgi:tellurite resistance protein TerC
VIAVSDVIFAVDSIPAVLAVTTDPFIVYTSNVFAVLGMRALYFLLAGAAARFRYLRPGLAVILAAVAVKLLLADVYHLPTWASPAFIAVVLGAVAVLSVRDNNRRRAARQPPGARAEGTAPRPPAGMMEAGSKDGRDPARRGTAATGGARSRGAA